MQSTRSHSPSLTRSHTLVHTPLRLAGTVGEFFVVFFFFRPKKKSWKIECFRANKKIGECFHCDLTRNSAQPLKPAPPCSVAITTDKCHGPSPTNNYSSSFIFLSNACLVCGLLSQPCAEHARQLHESFFFSPTENRLKCSHEPDDRRAPTEESVEKKHPTTTFQIQLFFDIARAQRLWTRFFVRICSFDREAENRKKGKREKEANTVRNKENWIDLWKTVAGPDMKLRNRKICVEDGVHCSPVACRGWLCQAWSRPAWTRIVSDIISPTFVFRWHRPRRAKKKRARIFNFLKFLSF